MVGQGHDIIIVKRASDLPEQMRERLHAEGYATVAVPDLRDIEQTIERLKDPIFLVETGAGGSGDVDFFKRLLASEAMARQGVVLVGRGAKSYLNALSESFTLTLAVPNPGSPAQIIQSLRDAADMLPIARERGVPTKIGKQTVEAISAAFGEKEAPRTPPTEPELFFERVRNLSLSKSTIGGAQYTSAIDAAFLKSADYLPQDHRMQVVIEKICADAGKWGRNHLYRTCYLAQCAASALKFPAGLHSAVLAGSFLWAWSFAGDKEDLLRKNYLRDSAHGLRHDIGSRVKDSALLAASELRDNLLTDILAKFARIIAKEEPPGTDLESTAASVILGADLVDRVCFHGTYWDSRAAYNLLRKFKDAKITELHPAVCCVLIKLLSETIAANPSTSLLPKKLRDNAVRMQKARKIREEPAEDGERRVDLNELAPGMKLSKPLYSFDGRQILEEDLTLDQDLVWRIWQLSAIRPLNPAKIATKKK